MTPYVVYWLLQVMCPFFQPLHVHVMPVMGSLGWPLLLVLSMIPTLLIVNVCILLFGVIEASTDPYHKTAKCRPKTWSESLSHMSWSMFAFMTGINRAKGCLAILQYGLQIYVAALLTGHSVKPMLVDTRSTAVRFRDTGVPYFAVDNLQASAMHVMTGSKLFGPSWGSDVLFAGQEGSPALGWWPSRLDFAMERLAGSSAQQPPRLIIPPQVNVSGSLSVIPKLTRMWGELVHTLTTGSFGERSLQLLKTSIQVCSPWVSWLHAQVCTLFSLILYVWNHIDAYFRYDMQRVFALYAWCALMTWWLAYAMGSRNWYFEQLASAKHSRVKQLGRFRYRCFRLKHKHGKWVKGVKPVYCFTKPRIKIPKPEFELTLSFSKAMISAIMISLYVLNYQAVHLYFHGLLHWAVIAIRQVIMPRLSLSRLEMLDDKSYHSWVAQLPHLSGTRIDSVDLTMASRRVNMVPSRTMHVISGLTNQLMNFPAPLVDMILASVCSKREVVPSVAMTNEMSSPLVFSHVKSHFMSTGREGHTSGTSLPTLPHLLGSHDMSIGSNVGESRLEPIVNYIFGNLLGQYLEPFPGFSILVVILVVITMLPNTFWHRLSSLSRAIEMEYYHNITFCDCPYVTSHYTTCWSCGKFPLRSPVVKPSPRAAAKSARRTPRNKRCRAYVLHTAIQHRYGLGHIANQPSVYSGCQSTNCPATGCACSTIVHEVVRSSCCGTMGMCDHEHLSCCPDITPLPCCVREHEQSEHLSPGLVNTSPSRVCCDQEGQVSMHECTKCHCKTVDEGVLPSNPCCVPRVNTTEQLSLSRRIKLWFPLNDSLSMTFYTLFLIIGFLCKTIIIVSGIILTIILQGLATLISQLSSTSFGLFVCPLWTLVCTWLDHSLWLPCTWYAPIGGLCRNKSNINMLCRFPARCLLTLHRSILAVISVVGPSLWQWCAFSMGCRILTSSPITNLLWDALITFPLWINQLFSWRGISFVGYHLLVGTLPRLGVRIGISWFVNLPIPPFFRMSILVCIMLHVFWCCTKLWAFICLYLRIRRARRMIKIVMTAQSANDRHAITKLPNVRSLQGMALKEEIDNFIAACLMLQSTDPCDEEFCIEYLLNAAGKHSAIGLCMETPSADPECNGDLPKIVAHRIAHLARQEFQRRRKMEAPLDGERDLLKELLDAYFPAFIPDPALQTAIDHWRSESEDTSQPYNIVLHAKDMLTNLEAQNRLEELAHAKLDPPAKLLWMGRFPELKHIVDYIERCLKEDRNKRRDERDDRDDREGGRRRRQWSTSQFKTVDDFTALRWLRDYLVKKVGAINQLHVDQWRTRIMCEGETPMDAFAKLRDDAMVLGNAGSVVSFIPDVELLRQVSQKAIEFFPVPLYDRILPIVKLRISNDASNSQTAKMCAIWVETAHEEFTDLPGRDPKLYLEIMAILKKRGKPPRWSTRSAAELFLQSSDSEKTKDPSVNPKNAKGQYYCHMCAAWGKHSTDHCNQFKNLKQRFVQQKPGQAPDPEVHQANPALAVTLMPQSDGDVLKKGFSPNSQVGKMQERQQQEKQEVPVCQRCTGFAGATIRHKIGNCFSDGRTAIPDWFTTPHAGLFNELNRIRATRGQPLLTPRDPNAPKGNGKKGKPKVATPTSDATQLADPDVPSGKRPRGEMAAMMTLAKSSYLGVSFDQHRREFTCSKCNRIMKTMHYPNGELSRIECSGCLISYPVTALPELWTQTSYWRSSGLEPISLRDISIPAGGFGSTISANLPVSETGNLAVEPPTIRPSIPRNFDWARTFDYRQPKAPINERPLQAGNTSVLHGIRNDPKVQLGMLMTRVFKKGHNIDVQNEFDRLVAQLPADEQVAQHAAFERARRSFTRTRVGTMPAAML
jgi:hypothetical protein